MGIVALILLKLDKGQPSNVQMNKYNIRYLDKGQLHA